jgi:tetratricopeptide (TPR) repeat protein
MHSRLAIGSALSTLLLASPILAQKTDPEKPLVKNPISREAARPDTDYSKEPSVIEQLRTSFHMENDGTGKEDQYARIRVQSVAGVQAWGQLIFSYNSANDHLQVVYVRVSKPDGHIVTAGPDAIQDLSSPIERVAPVYTDLRQLHVTVPDLAAGDTLEYSLHTDSSQPVIPGQFFLQWNSSKMLITLDESFQLDVPRGRVIQLKTATGQKPPEVNESADRRTYTWRASFTKRQNDPGDEKKKSSDEPPHDDVLVSTFTSWAQVGEWYAVLEHNRAAMTDTIRAKALELTAGETTDLGKVKAIYDYVSKNIRYISLSFGVGRYQPHSAAEVLANQYGDCKDKATLLEALLSAIRIEAYPVLINSQREIDREVPSPGQFDHLISRISFGGKDYWADATPGVAPFGFLLSPLRDKYALVIPTNAKASLERTPELLPFTPIQTVELSGKLNALGRLEGNVIVTATGDSAVVIRIALRQIPQNYWKQMAESITRLVSGLPNAEVKEFRFKDVDNLEEPLNMEAQFSAPNFLDLTKKSAEFDLSSRAVEIPGVDEPEAGSKEPLKIGGPLEESERWKLELPDQLTATLPVDVQLTRDYADYHSTYSLANHLFTFERHLTVKGPKISVSRFADFAAFRTAALADQGQKLSFENSIPGLGAIPAGATANELYGAANQAFNSNNFVQAARLFESVVEKDPEYKGAWNDLGRAYVAMRSYDKAISALEKAIQQNPYDPFAYNNLGRAYLGKGQYDDAIRQFQKQLEINPSTNMQPSISPTFICSRRSTISHRSSSKRRSKSSQIIPGCISVWGKRS